MSRREEVDALRFAVPAYAWVLAFVLLRLAAAGDLEAAQRRLGPMEPDPASGEGPRLLPSTARRGAKVLSDHPAPASVGGGRSCCTPAPWTAWPAAC